MSFANVNNIENIEAANKDMVTGKVVNIDHNAAPELKDEEVNVSNSGTDVILMDCDYDEEIIKCAEILVNLSKSKAKAIVDFKTDTIDEEENSAEAVVVKSNKKPGKGCKSYNRRNVKNKKLLHKEPTIIPMELIGKRTFIKSSVYDKINWSCYTKATRTLLMEIFPRKVLATHSLSGNKSPAFLDRAAKPGLDTTRIADIIQTICTKCEVTENLVRQVITTKCADEAKMLRQREKNKLMGDVLSEENKSDVESDLENKNQYLKRGKQGQLSDEEEFYNVLRLVQRKLQFGD